MVLAAVPPKAALGSPMEEAALAAVPDARASCGTTAEAVSVCAQERAACLGV